MILCKIREFIRNSREIRERVVTKDITILLCYLVYLEYFPDDSLNMNNSVRYVHCYLVCKVFRWGTRKYSQHYCLKSHILEEINNYVWRMMKENVARQRSIIYMNESYICNNYCCHEKFLYDPNDEQDLTTISHNKGQRYCFIATIVDAYHGVPAFERTDAQKAGVLHNTLDIFEGRKEVDKGI